MRVRVKVGERVYEAEVTDLGGGRYRVEVEGHSIEVEVREETTAPQIPKVARSASITVPSISTQPATEIRQPVSGNVVVAPISGKVIRVLVKPGDVVEPSTVVLTLESMKMELEVRAGRRGRVREVLVKPGDSVRTGQPLVTLVSG